jgi:hypothetical protein
VSDDVTRAEPVTAIVLLRSASGEEVTGLTPITADTLSRYAPDPADVERLARGFREAGFEVGAPVGISLTVTGPLALFEEFFGVTVSRARDGGWVAGDAAHGRRELPLSALPTEVAARVSAVTFDEPAEPVGP